jgi:gamma-glutamylcyclotransferase (GGCT)/AIG2-like uncharacterized protein YtfP
MFNLFVYGTLKRGGRAAELMQGCEWLGTATVGGVLYNIDDQFTTLIVYGNTPVHGEVWRCPPDMLKQLDEYEGVDSGLFRRIGVTVTLADGERVGCWIYVAGPKLARKLTPDRQIVTTNVN